MEKQCEDDRGEVLQSTITQTDLNKPILKGDRLTEGNQFFDSLQPIEEEVQPLFQNQEEIPRPNIQNEDLPLTESVLPVDGSQKNFEPELPEKAHVSTTEDKQEHSHQDVDFEPKSEEEKRSSSKLLSPVMLDSSSQKNLNVSDRLESTSKKESTSKSSESSSSSSSRSKSDSTSKKENEINPNDKQKADDRVGNSHKSVEQSISSNIQPELKIEHQNLEPEYVGTISDLKPDSQKFILNENQNPSEIPDLNLTNELINGKSISI